MFTRTTIMHIHVVAAPLDYPRLEATRDLNPTSPNPHIPHPQAHVQQVAHHLQLAISDDLLRTLLLTWLAAEEPAAPAAAGASHVASPPNNPTTRDPDTPPPGEGGPTPLDQLRALHSMINHVLASFVEAVGRQLERSHGVAEEAAE